MILIKNHLKCPLLDQDHHIISIQLMNNIIQSFKELRKVVEKTQS